MTHRVGIFIPPVSRLASESGLGIPLVSTLRLWDGSPVSLVFRFPPLISTSILPGLALSSNILRNSLLPRLDSSDFLFNAVVQFTLFSFLLHEPKWVKYLWIVVSTRPQNKQISLHLTSVNTVIVSEGYNTLSRVWKKLTGVIMTVQTAFLRVSLCLVRASWVRTAPCR